jgi:photosystem II stability/assembly factor-like uncharacterized protein
MKNNTYGLTLLLLTIFLNLANAQINANWKLTGPDKFPTNKTVQINGIGRISQVVFHPTDPNKMYAASASGGLFISKDGAKTWSPTGTDKLPNISCASVCVDYTNDKIIYLGSGDANYYSRSSGVWKSTDGGTTWFQSGSGMANRLTLDLLMDPTNNKVLIGATNDGIIKSTDAGATWTVKKTGGEFQQMLFKPNNPDILYAVTVNEFYRSTDKGETWTSIAFPGPTVAGGRIGVSKADPNTVYATFVGVSATSLSTPVYKSMDAGLTFKIVKPANASNLNGYTPDGTGQGRYNFAMTVDPLDANNVWIAAHCVWNSRDGGITWKKMTNWAREVHTDMHQIIYSPHDPAKLFNANDGGVWIIDDAGIGAQWKAMSDGLACTEIYHAAQNPMKKEVMAMGTQDNGILAYDTGIDKWITTRGGDYSETFAYSYNGNRYNPSAGGLGVPSPFKPGTACLMEFTALKKEVAFITDTEIWRTDSVSAPPMVWTQISNFNDKVKALCISPVDANVVYAVTNDGNVYRSDNALSNAVVFKSVSMNPSPKGGSTSLAVMKSAPNVVYLSCTSKVYRSADKGVTWTDVSAGLPAINFIKMYHDIYSKDESIYIASGAAAVYYKNKNMASWINYSKGLPTITNVKDFMIYNDGDYANSVLRVSYYGRGIWETPLYNSTTGIDENAEDENRLTVFPNPSSQSISISFTTSESIQGEILIYDLLGKVVKAVLVNQQVSAGEHLYTVDVSSLNAGAYICKVNFEGTIKSKLFVKE